MTPYCIIDAADMQSGQYINFAYLHNIAIVHRHTLHNKISIMSMSQYRLRYSLWMRHNVKGCLVLMTLYYFTLWHNHHYMTQRYTGGFYFCCVFYAWPFCSEITLDKRVGHLCEGFISFSQVCDAISASGSDMDRLGWEFMWGFYIF